MNLRVWFRLCGSAYVMFPATVVAWTAEEGSAIWWLAIIGLVWGIGMALMGATLGILMACGKRPFTCPNCGRRGEVDMDRRFLHFQCPECGPLYWRLGWFAQLIPSSPPVEEPEIETQDPLQDLAPLFRPRRRILFWMLPVAIVFVISCVQYRFTPVFFFPVLLSYIGASMMNQALLRGWVDGRYKRVYRSKQPWGFWSDSFFFLLFYLFPMAWSIVFALQEAAKQPAP